MKDDIPSSKLKRSGVAALAIAKVGARQLSHLSKRPFLSKQQKEKQSHATDAANADVIFKALVQSRGTALKVAQMLSMETDLLPDDIAKS